MALNSLAVGKQRAHDLCVGGDARVRYCILTFVAAFVVALVVGGTGIVVYASKASLRFNELFNLDMADLKPVVKEEDALPLLFVPLEILFALHPRKVFRKGLLTDLTHFIVDDAFVAVGTIVLVAVAAIPFFWIRSFELQALLPSRVALALAIVLAFVGQYWGHRITHMVPLLWRFHAVHHSIEQMDWVAAGRLHPFDAAFTQASAAMPLFLLGYRGSGFAGAAIFLTLLGLFQHANVRLRFPLVRWIVPTPEWHHWHHAIDEDAYDKNFGLPVVDKIFGTAYLPKGVRPTAFGTRDRVPQTGYLAHLAYPFRHRRQAPAAEASKSSTSS